MAPRRHRLAPGGPLRNWETVAPTFFESGAIRFLQKQGPLQLTFVAKVRSTRCHQTKDPRHPRPNIFRVIHPHNQSA